MLDTVVNFSATAAILSRIGKAADSLTSLEQTVRISCANAGLSGEWIRSVKRIRHFTYDVNLVIDRLIRINMDDSMALAACTDIRWNS